MDLLLLLLPLLQEEMIKSPGAARSGAASRLSGVVRVAIEAFVGHYVKLHLRCFSTVITQNPNLISIHCFIFYF